MVGLFDANETALDRVVKSQQKPVIDRPETREDDSLKQPCSTACVRQLLTRVLDVQRRQMMELAVEQKLRRLSATLEIGKSATITQNDNLSSSCEESKVDDGRWLNAPVKPLDRVRLRSSKASGDLSQKT